jgi:hypothetical protein
MKKAIFSRNLLRRISSRNFSRQIFSRNFSRQIFSRNGHTTVQNRQFVLPLTNIIVIIDPRGHESCSRILKRRMPLPFAVWRPRRPPWRSSYKRDEAALETHTHTHTQYVRGCLVIQTLLEFLLQKGEKYPIIRT